jgi:3-hydroxymyristoyl/3-hydroxydecanoyl-(acyl carrier protein) dehydratase
VKVELRRVIHADHPSLPGHFPGRPIVPGVVILDEVFNAVVESQGDCRLHGVPIVKFLGPLRPDEPFTVSLSKTDESTVEFACYLDERVFAQGRFQVGQSI